MSATAEEVQTIDLPRLIRTVIQFCKDRPDNVYTRPIKSSVSGSIISCKYSAGDCKDGTCGCVFGQALAFQGIDVKALDISAEKYVTGGTGIEAVLRHNNCAVTGIVRDWLLRLQGRQDNGDTWGEALASANVLHPIVAVDYAPIDLPRLIRTVIRFATERPDNVYINVSGNNDSCSYLHGTCTDGTCGCIFGQALIEQGYNVDPEFDASDFNAITQLLTNEGHKLSKHKERWLLAFQRKQDAGGNTWAAALREANLAEPDFAKTYAA